MSDIERHGVTARYADAVIHNEVIHLVEVPATSSADITTQTREVLDSIDRQLARLGSDRSRILMATIYLTDLADCAAMNAVWDIWVPQGSAPSRACVQVAGLVDPGWRIEVALTAARGEKPREKRTTP
jgi:enamine deaminase RidA (YjgF/YER057c/UK114 family)